MKVLWLCNVGLSEAYEYLKLDKPNVGGWLQGAFNGVNILESFNLAIAFPAGIKSNLLFFNIGNIQYYVFRKSEREPHIYDQKYEKVMEQILNDYHPDIVHIWGTEFPHSLAMTKVFNHPNQTIVSLQGLCSIYELHYYAFLPNEIVRERTLRDLLKRDSIVNQKTKFKIRGLMEMRVLKSVNHVIGRTEWDYACSRWINNKLHYHKCYESLRPHFYRNNWILSKCRKHSIFISQANYPIKGFHLILKALPNILLAYPDAAIYTTSRNIFEVLSFRLTSYERYLKHIIIESNLFDHVFFLGQLDEEAICQQYLASNVFVCPSSIENSPNSVAEAMILGVPTVCSDVGGVKDFIQHGKNAFLYPADEWYMIPYYIDKIFSDESVCNSISLEAKKIREKYDIAENGKTLINIYHDVLEDQ
ncbi:MAG: glycosyltransferase [Erysipelotrichaceae bacterium]|nr:glycosyltransferase [Erysipelotrichaceae bacterium]